MGMEDIKSEASDFLGDVAERITDGVIDVGNATGDFLESVGDEGREALENGDVPGVIENTDLPGKELANVVIKEFGIDKSLMVKGGVEIAGGLLIASASLAVGLETGAWRTAAAGVSEGVKLVAAGMNDVKAASADRVSATANA